MSVPGFDRTLLVIAVVLVAAAIVIIGWSVGNWLNT